MARTISDEELQLRRRARRRLIGAVVLVTAVVVVLPMVLDSEPKPAGPPVSVQIPSPDSGGFAPRLAPPSVSTQPPKAAPEPIKPAPAQAADYSSGMAAVPPAQQAASEPSAAPKDAPAPPVKPPTKPKPAAAKVKGGQYVVQVIALADAGKAEQMQQRIAGAGIKSYTEVVKTAKGDVTRVRAGPFATRGAAEKARDQLKALGMNGNITPK